jgi:hypothetical protein
MGTALKAGIIYFVIVFLIGFTLGTIRVLLVIPQLGETAAVLIEAPIMLAVSWVAALWSIKLFEVPASRSLRALMGITAFTLLALAELGVSVFAFGRSLADHVAGYRTVAGGVGLAAQVAFAFLPLMQLNRRIRRYSAH